jgi:hypothetical protein
MASFGALVLIRIKGESEDTFPAFLENPVFFLISMGFFATCAGATLFHRYFAADCMSWYIAWLRADAKEKLKMLKLKEMDFIECLSYLNGPSYYRSFYLAEESYFL